MVASTSSAAAPAQDADFSRLVRAARQLFGAPAAAIVRLEGDTLHFHTREGLADEPPPVPSSPWRCLMTTPGMSSLVVSDATLDKRFAADEAAGGLARLRFFACVPIIVHGERYGALGVMSPMAGREPGPERIAALADLAAVAGSLFELKDEAKVRARMAADLIREEWRHALTLEAGRVGSWVWDVRSDEIACNDIFRHMFGLEPASKFHFRELEGLVEPADLPAFNAALDEAFEQGVDYAAEFRVAASGRWLIGRGRVYQRDGDGRPLVMMGVNIDVTDAREAAEQQRLLLRELNHRVKNTLAMIQSLARQTLRQKPDPQQFIDAFSGRLRTLSDAHTLLSDRDWSGIGLVELLRSQVEPYLLDSPDQFVMEGDDLRLPPDHALGLGLIIHELASNAVKFGALSRPDGRVTVTWTVSRVGDRRLELVWKESGGPMVMKPAEAGFGTRLIERSLDKVLGSSVKLSFPIEGAEARISLPLERFTF